ncbi:MAG: LPS export ABC transporter ATP-binding protein [Rhodospirillaceae bacterium]|nr:LPS export ABC transporter ATP-binding protein [Rhodospirillaceae bacterium]
MTSRLTSPPSDPGEEGRNADETTAGQEPEAVDENGRPRPRLVPQPTGLVARNLRKGYRKRIVLRDVSVSVRRGEVVGLLGPNGAGKTTCFYAIMGMVKPDAGRIILGDEDITDLPMYRRARLGVGYLPQEASIFRGLNVEENIRAVLEVCEPDRVARETILEGLLAEFGIEHLRRAPSLALSGGERRRVEIARALATNPHYMLLDEPLAGIDPIAVGEIRELVGTLRDRGIGVLITDHNVRETLDIVDRAYILHDGRVLMEGEPEEIVAHKDVRRVYLGERFSL